MEKVKNCSILIIIVSKISTSEAKNIMEEKEITENRETDPLVSWKSTSSLILALCIALLCFKVGINCVFAFLIIFPLRYIFNGFFDNKVQRILSGISALIMLMIFSGSFAITYNHILELAKEFSAAGALAYAGASAVFFILFLLIMAIANFLSKMLPDFKIPDMMHKTGMIIIFSLTLLIGLIAVWIILLYLKGKFLSFPDQLTVWLPVILGTIGIIALIKMVKNVLNYDPLSAANNSTNGQLLDRPSVTLADVAGMDDIKEQIRLRMIEPVKKPEEAKKYGLKKGGGVMLYGPPGTGKTFIARAVAGELAVPFYTLNAADIFSKYVGDSEKKLQNFFENVRKNPLSVVFVDEMEIIFAKRTDHVHEVTQKVISIILQELDGVNQNKNPILLLGATNTPWKVDEAFLRPGRFDILAFVGLPDFTARKQIIASSLKQDKLKFEENLAEYIAENTDNFSGADLNGLMTTLRQVAFDRKEKCFTKSLAKDILKNISPSINHDLMQQISEWQSAHGTQSAAKKTLLSNRPSITLADVAGMDDVKKQINLRLIEPIKNPELAEKYGLQKGGGVMLYGPPGTGKTFIAKAVAGELDLPFYTITAADVFSKNVGESEQNIRNIFSEAGKNPMSIIFVDEMETIFSNRNRDIHEVTQKVISLILQELDGIKQRKNPILLLGATNTPWNIDEAFLRPGRFDILAFVGLPDFEARKQILQTAFKKGNLPIEDGLFEYIAENTQAYSGADLNGLVSTMRQKAYENRNEFYSMDLAYEIMLNNRPPSKRETLLRIKEWENSRKQST